MPMFTVAQEKHSPVSLHVQDFGEGKPVVLIHGWPLSSRSWEPQIPALVDAGYRVITYDRRGFGASSQPYGGYDYDTLASDLDQVMTQLDLRRATLVGFSMGGGEVARYLGKYGQARVAKAVFASAVTPYLYKIDDNPDGAVDVEKLEMFEKGVRTDRLAFLDDFFSKKFFNAGVLNKVSDEQRAYAKQIAAFASPQGTLKCIRAFACTDFRNDLARLDLPTLIIHGDSDQTVPFEASGKRTAAMLKGSSYVLIKGAPHGCNISHPEEFNQALLTFLAR